MMERLQVILAGRAAEEVAFDMPTTYSISDLRVSTSVIWTPYIPAEEVVFYVPRNYSIWLHHLENSVSMSRNWSLKCL